MPFFMVMSGLFPRRRSSRTRPFNRVFHDIGEQQTHSKKSPSSPCYPILVLEFPRTKGQLIDNVQRFNEGFDRLLWDFGSFYQCWCTVEVCLGNGVLAPKAEKADEGMIWGRRQEDKIIEQCVREQRPINDVSSRPLIMEIGHGRNSTCPSLHPRWNWPTQWWEQNFCWRFSRGIFFIGFHNTIDVPLFRVRCCS